MDNWTILHLHSMDSNPYSGLQVDSITSYEDYIKEAHKCGMKAIAFTEHGSVLRNVAKKQMCDKLGIKHILAEEFYVTESIEFDEKGKPKCERDNYHCLLYGANQEGCKELRALSTKAMNKEDGHFYYNPRITIEELENTSDNIFVLTGCVAGMLAKGTPTIQERFLKFIIANKHRCWLEIQPHRFDFQVQYNMYLHRISQKYGLKLIATNDIHALSPDSFEARSVLQKGKKVVFHDEDNCDLSWKNYDEIVQAFKFQNALPYDVFMDAIEETNRFADMIEPYSLDYSNKYPRLYKDAETEFKSRIVKGIKERGIDKLPNYKTDYVPRINEEFKTYKKNDAIDFMLLDSDYKLWMLNNGMHYGPSRGSCSGSIIAYLLHNTDVDSVKYNLNFSRFMNPERQSLADIDTDIYAEDRYKVREYFFNQSNIHCCNIITFNTIQMRTAIKDIGRGLQMSVSETDAISKRVETDENGKDFASEELRNEYPLLFKYVDMVIGTITSLGRHAAGIVVSPTNIEEDFGLASISSDPRPISQIDMHEIDSLNYVKMDLLGLNAVGLIYKACDLIGIDCITPDSIDFSDENIIKSIAEDTTMIFQFESGFASDGLKQSLSGESLANIRQHADASYLDIMAMCNGAIRPAGESYRDDLFKGNYHDNGSKVLNDFLAPTLGQLVYQEQIIDFLNKFCGFTMGQADIVRRGFAKKTGTEQYIPIIKNGGYMQDIHGNKDDRYIKGFIAIAQEQYDMSKEEAENAIVYFLEVIEAASSYIFSKNHAVPYSMIGLMIGWLRYYHPLQLFTAALNVYQDNDSKMNEIKAYIRSKGVEIKPIRFGKSKSEFFMDVENNCIYQGIESIKNCNSKIGEELYELSKNKYDSFISLLVDIKEKTSVQRDHLEILTKLNFFCDFGDINALIKQELIFDKIYGKSQFKKAKLEELHIPEFIIQKVADKETEKMYKLSDSIKLIKALVDRGEYPKTTIIDRIAYELEYMDVIYITIPTLAEDYYYVQEIKDNWVTLYQLQTGNTLKIKYRRGWGAWYKTNPFYERQIIKVTDIHPEHKKRPRKDENGNEVLDEKGKKIWDEIEEMEDILGKWIVVKE